MPRLATPTSSASGAGVLRELASVLSCIGLKSLTKLAVNEKYTFEMKLVHDEQVEKSICVDMGCASPPTSFSQSRVHS